MRKADYEKIAASYDKGRPISEQNIDLWMELISRYAGAKEGSRVLDLGCGTGRFSIPMAHKLNYRVVGADFSKEMLKKAREKDTDSLVEWDHQDAQSLMYPNASFDAVFMSHLLHHVDSPLQVLRECQRVLVMGGPVLIRYGAIEQIRDDVEHTFFPETLAIDEERTPTVKEVEQWLGKAGFSGILSIQEFQQTYDSGMTHLEAVKLKSTSVLTMISEEAFKRGVRKLSEYIKESPNDPWLMFDRFTLTVGYNNPPRNSN